MSLVYFIVGLVLLCVAVVDLLWTTLWVDGGAGPLTQRLTAWGWSGLRKIASDRPEVLSLAGPLLIGVTLLTWIVLLWVGWTCVFASGENALVNTQGEGPVTLTGRIYYVGYTMFTLGIGDIVPGSGAWRIATILATANGMLFVTMSVSYLISVLGAVTLKRSFASTVTGIGMRSEEFVCRGWNGEDFRGFDQILPTLATELEQLTYQHKAYPILHYYYSHEYEHSSAIGTAILDEALTLLSYGVQERCRPQTIHLVNARTSTKRYLNTLHSAYVPLVEDTPKRPDLDILRADGIPTVSNDEFETALSDLIERRQRLLRMIKEDAREWPS